MTHPTPGTLHIWLTTDPACSCGAALVKGACPHTHGVEPARPTLKLLQGGIRVDREDRQ